VIRLPACSPRPLTRAYGREMAREMIGIRTNLEVHDVPRSIAFYRRALGLDVMVTMGEPPTFAILAADDVSIAIAHAERPALATIAACYVDVVDVEVAHRRCRDADVAIAAPITTHPWGMRDFVFRDPDGHQIAVGQRIQT
jgi:predicted enzyme related to lactoylglutathione lyase